MLDVGLHRLHLVFDRCDFCLQLTALDSLLLQGLVAEIGLQVLELAFSGFHLKEYIVLGVDLLVVELGEFWFGILRALQQSFEGVQIFLKDILDTFKLIFIDVTGKSLDLCNVS